MKYIIDIEENKTDFAREFFKAISFVKTFTIVESNEIVNPAILQSIDDYEKGKIRPTPLSLTELKAMLDA